MLVIRKILTLVLMLRVCLNSAFTFLPRNGVINGLPIHSSLRPVTSAHRRGLTSVLPGASSLASSPFTATEVEKYSNTNNRDDQILSLLSSCGGVKLTLISIRNLMNDLSLAQNLSPLSMRGLGSSFSCGAMLASGMDESQIFQITVNGGGPMRGIVSISDSEGGVKGYVGNPAVGELPLKDAIGEGSINIVKNHPDWPRPYNGITSIVTGDIAQDVGVYLAQSEQRSCAIHADVRLNGLLITGAGGYLVEKLPDCEEGLAERIEENLEILGKEMGGEGEKDSESDWFMNSLVSGTDLLTIASQITSGSPFAVLDSKTPSSRSDCCSSERLIRSLSLLPESEIDDIIKVGENVEAKCEFCGTEYKLTPEEVRDEIKKAKEKRESGGE
ncbi:hypothetical protein TrRE_jg11452 [Triparma retinervis]|uniref:Uncharacterized protein n=1 Tax=Triparma retinervis TaxID=2557542 RepID=A0A9W7FIB1_9STRA|nr:hypothetical protein TrRE_jg11452 [Triparma retinervis]